MMSKKYKLFLALTLLLCSSFNGANAAKDVDCKGMYNKCMAGMIYGYNPDCQAYGDPGTAPVKACDDSDKTGVTWSISCRAGCLKYPGCSDLSCPQPSSAKTSAK